MTTLNPEVAIPKAYSVACLALKNVCIGLIAVAEPQLLWSVTGIVP
jgi:hypothetical protein